MKVLLPSYSWQTNKGKRTEAKAEHMQTRSNRDSCCNNSTSHTLLRQCPVKWTFLLRVTPGPQMTHCYCMYLWGFSDVGIWTSVDRLLCAKHNLTQWRSGQNQNRGKRTLTPSTSLPGWPTTSLGLALALTLVLPDLSLPNSNWITPWLSQGFSAQRQAREFPASLITTTNLSL